jgi:LysR family transcriptional activator of mexEF-oprN operon
MKCQNEFTIQRLVIGLEQTNHLSKDKHKGSIERISKAQHCIEIAISKDLLFGTLPKLMIFFEKNYPELSLKIHITEAPDLNLKLSTGGVSLALGYSNTHQEGVHYSSLGKSEPMVLRTDRRPGFLTVDEYCGRKHISIKNGCTSCRDVDTALSSQGRKRDFTAELESYDDLTRTLANSDYLATVPSHVASALAARGGVRAEKTPFSTTSTDLMMLWPSQLHEQKDQMLLRQQIARILAVTSTLSFAEVNL